MTCTTSALQILVCHRLLNAFGIVLGQVCLWQIVTESGQVTDLCTCAADLADPNGQSNIQHHIWFTDAAR